jgi:hypothetical protein
MFGSRFGYQWVLSDVGGHVHQDVHCALDILTQISRVVGVEYHHGSRLSIHIPPSKSNIQFRSKHNNT